MPKNLLKSFFLCLKLSIIYIEVEFVMILYNNLFVHRKEKFMSSEDKIILKQYTKITEFLGRALGPDYEIALHDLSDKNHSIIAIANNHISGRTIGAPLTNAALRIIADKSYHDTNYRLHHKGMSQKGKILRSSTFFIKNRHENLIGLLCINFDDSRYTELSDHLLGLCHPDTFVETTFLYDEEQLSYSKTVDSASNTPFLDNSENKRSSIQTTDIFHNTTGEVTNDAVWQVLNQLEITSEHLNPSERLDVIRTLHSNGIFLLKGSVKIVAEVLHCSVASVYRYLSEIKEE